MQSFRPRRQSPTALLADPCVDLPAPRQTDCCVFVDGIVDAVESGHATALQHVRELGRGFVWLDLQEPEHSQLHSIADAFDLHPLAVETTLRARQRPKAERYDDGLFLVLKTLTYVGNEVPTPGREIVTGEIIVFVGRDFVVTVRRGEHSGLSRVRRLVETSPSTCVLGPYAVMHAVADHVVGEYLAALRLIGADIDQMEEDVFSPGPGADIEHVYLLKRDVIHMRRAIGSLTHALRRSTEDCDDLIPTEVNHYMRDVLQHNVDATERVVGYDELLGSLLDSACGRETTRQNVDMRKISAWAALGAVSTTVSGIYGMRFVDIPETHWAYGYPAVLAILAVTSALFFRRFRRDRWL
jgi:magnesium transporter